MRQRTFVQRKALIGNIEHAGRIWRSILGFGGWIVVAIAGVELIPFMRWHGVLIGFLLGTFVTFVTVAVLRVHDPIVHGSWAEQWSLESLRKVPDWLVTENLPFEGVDIDHVVVTPSAVLAVETKYRGTALVGRSAAERHRRDIESALAAARKLSLFLRTQDLPSAPQVLPVLMVWGAGKPDLPAGSRQERGVTLVDAANPRVWSHRFAAPMMTREVRDEIHEAVTNYIARRHGYQADRLPPLTHEMWRAFRRGNHEQRERRRSLRELRSSLNRRHGS